MNTDLITLNKRITYAKELEFLAGIHRVKYSIIFHGSQQLLVITCLEIFHNILLN